MFFCPGPSNSDAERVSEIAYHASRSNIPASSPSGCLTSCGTRPALHKQVLRSCLSGFRFPGILVSGILAASFLLALGTKVAAQAPSLISAPIDLSRVQVLRDHHPQWANAANDAGPLLADQQVQGLTLVLARTAAQDAAFEQFLADQQNPASANYHHWLTAAEIGERFGPSDTDVAAIKGWLQSAGLQVSWIAPSKTFIGFGGTATEIAAAFQTELHNYRVNGRSLVSVSSDPMVPQAVAPAIKAIRGLYTIEEEPQSRARVMEMDSPDITASDGTHFIGTGDFFNIYSLPNGITGSGVTIGIVARSRTDAADFDNFKSRIGGVFADPTEVVPTAFGGVDPGPPYMAPPGSSVSIGDQSEATLDVERAGSVAEGAHLLLVVATQASGGIEVDAQYLVQTVPAPVQVMNISFGGCESAAGPTGVNFWDSLFQQAAAEGISSFVSSGDSGASGCDADYEAPPASPKANSPNYICSSSYATCVGGTEFNDTSNPTMYWQPYSGVIGTSATGYIPEGGWNESWNGTTSEVAASGGGVSSVIATPTWQQGVAGVPAANTGRYTPDVAFSASEHDGYLGCFAAGGGNCVLTNGSIYFTVFAGTSAAAPSMAAIAALLDQNGSTAQGNLNPGIYLMSISAPTAFHDVTLASSGVTLCDINTSLCNNSISGPSGLSGGQAGYEVGTGYDEVTGLGSLDANIFVNAYPTASKIQTPTVQVESLMWPVNQNIPVGVGVAGGAYSPGATGSIVLTAGSYTSAAIPETGAYQYVNIPAGTLAMGTYTVTASYTPDAASSPIYKAASGTGQLTVSAPQYITPLVGVAPSASTITSTEPITLLVRVGAGVGNPAPTGTVTVTSGSYSSGIVALVPGNGMFNDGEAVINVPAGTFPVGQDTLTVNYVPDASGASLYLAASSSYTITNIGAQVTPSVQVRLSSQNLTTAQYLTVAVVVSAPAGDPTPTGSVVVSGGNYTSAATSLTGNGVANVQVAPGALAVGTDLLTGTYTPDAQSSALYSGGSAANTVTVTIPANANFTITGNSFVLTKGSQSSNTSAITVTPTNGFVGTVALTAAITASPAGAQDLPTMSFTTPSVNLAGPNAANSTLTFTTTGASSAKLVDPPGPWMRWSTAAAPVLACVVLWFVPLRRRLWRNMMMFAGLAILIVGGVAACGGSGGGGGGGGNPGTTSGQYTITITGTSGATTVTNTITLTVQ